MSMENSRAGFPSLGQVYWTFLQVKANCDLHSAAKGIEKNILVILIVAGHKLPSVQIEILACLAWQHLAAAWLHSRHYNLLLVFTLDQTFPVAIWNCYKVSECCWSLQGFPADESAYAWESGGLGWCDIGIRWLHLIYEFFLFFLLSLQPPLFLLLFL